MEPIVTCRPWQCRGAKKSGRQLLQTIPAGPDLYLLKHILHDWTDEQCAQILAENVAAAMEPCATLLICEMLLGRNRPALRQRL